MNFLRISISTSRLQMWPRKFISVTISLRNPLSFQTTWFKLLASTHALAPIHSHWQMALDLNKWILCCSVRDMNIPFRFWMILVRFVGYWWKKYNYPGRNTSNVFSADWCSTAMCQPSLQTHDQHRTSLNVLHRNSLSGKQRSYHHMTH